MDIALVERLVKKFGVETVNDLEQWLSQQLQEKSVTRDEYREILTCLDILEKGQENLQKAVDNIASKVETLRTEINQRIDQINMRFDNIQKDFNMRFDNMQKDFNDRMDKVNDRMDKMNERIEKATRAMGIMIISAVGFISVVVILAKFL